jgi:cell division protein FtsW (lipid II flippase)
VSLRIGLGIGRLVFRALNTVEAVLAVALVAAIILASAPIRVVIATVVAVAALAVQLALVRPRLTRRSDRILAGTDAPRSRSHDAYVALEAAKVGALLAAGVLLLAA